MAQVMSSSLALMHSYPNCRLSKALTMRITISISCRLLHYKHRSVITWLNRRSPRLSWLQNSFRDFNNSRKRRTRRLWLTKLTLKMCSSKIRTLLSPQCSLSKVPLRAIQKLTWAAYLKTLSKTQLFQNLLSRPSSWKVFQKVKYAPQR